MFQNPQLLSNPIQPLLEKTVSNGTVLPGISVPPATMGIQAPLSTLAMAPPAAKMNPLTSVTLGAQEAALLFPGVQNDETLLELPSVSAMTSPQFRPAHELLAHGSSEIHMLRGLAPFLPSRKVFDTIRERVLSARVSNRHHSALPLSQLAFYVLDTKQLHSRFNLWKQCFPDIVPFYAVKSNPNPVIIKTMVDDFGPTEFGFDCASKSEIQAVLAAGGHAEQIVFANPCKNLDHVEYSKSVHVLRSTFDSPCELLKIKSVHPDAEMILRIWTNDEDSQCPLSNKYGAHKKEVVPLLEYAQSLGIKVVGISFHCGSGARPETYVQALKDAKWAFDAGLSLGHPMSVLDVGGGFPGVDTAELNLAEIAQCMRPLLDRDWVGVTKIAEPGRFFSATLQTLACQVIGKRLRPDEKLKDHPDGNLRREYFVNDGLYQSFNCMLYDHSVLLPEATSDDAVASTSLMAHPTPLPSKVFGQTCDGLDCITEDISLPDLRVGDWLIVPVMGAYTNGAASNFNGFESNPVIYI